MSKYLQAGDLFRKAERATREKLVLDRQFHAGDSTQKDELAPVISAAMQSANEAAFGLHSLGFSMRVEKANERWDVVKLLEDGDEIAHYEIQRF